MEQFKVVDKKTSKRNNENNNKSLDMRRWESEGDEEYNFRQF